MTEVQDVAARDACALLATRGLPRVVLYAKTSGGQKYWLLSCADPAADFKDAGGEKIFEADLMVDEADDYDRCLIERVGDLLVATRSRVIGRDVIYVGGSVAVCESGTAMERGFVSDALEDFMGRAVGPVASIVEGAKKSRLKMNESCIKSLVDMLRGLSIETMGS